MFAFGLNHPWAGPTVLWLGGAASLLLGARRCRLRGWRLVLLCAAAVLGTVLFSHGLYCLVDMDYIISVYGASYLFAFWRGGYMVYGGLLGAWLAMLAAPKGRRAKALEAFAPSVMLMIAFLRLWEGIMGRGYGEYCFEETFFCRFPFMVFDQYNEVWRWALFVAEALIALLLAFLALKHRPLWAGDSALLTVGLYAAFQVVLESLRRDDFLRWGFVRIEQVISAVAILCVLTAYARRGRGHAGQKAMCYALFFSMVVLCLLLEFATEGRVRFLSMLTPAGCYAVMTFACLLMAVSICWMRRLCALPAKEK